VQFHKLITTFQSSLYGEITKDEKVREKRKKGLPCKDPWLMRRELGEIQRFLSKRGDGTDDDEALFYIHLPYL